MKWLIGCVVLLSASLNSYAADGNECANTNPYLQQACQQMKQAADAAKKATDEAYQKSAEEGKKEVEKSIAVANQPAEPPKKALPAWQQAITPPSASAPSAGATATTNTRGMTPATSTPQAPINSVPATPAVEGAVAVTQAEAPPAPGPAEMAGPAAINGPGAMTIVPVKKSNHSGAGAAMYY